MRTPAEYEAELDRLAAALDLEAKARASMAEAFARATDDLKAAEEKLKARNAFLIQCRDALASGEASDYPVWLNIHTTILEAINLQLDDPKARGEQALPLDIV